MMSVGTATEAATPAALSAPEPLPTVGGLRCLQRPLSVELAERCESDTACLLVEHEATSHSGFRPLNVSEQHEEQDAETSGRWDEADAARSWLQRAVACGRSEPLLLWTLVGVAVGVAFGSCLHAAHGGPLPPSQLELLGLMVGWHISSLLGTYLLCAYCLATGVRVESLLLSRRNPNPGQGFFCEKMQPG